MSYLQQRFNQKLQDKKAPKKGIAHFSAKRQKQQRDYVRIVKEMMEESDRCEMNVVGVCQGKATGLHHLKKRIGFLTDKRYLKRSCNACNYWAEQYPLEAVKLGLSLSKFKE